MDFDTALLRALVAVADTGGFTRAAERLLPSQAYCTQLGANGKLTCTEPSLPLPGALNNNRRCLGSSGQLTLGVVSSAAKPALY